MNEVNSGRRQAIAAVGVGLAASLIGAAQAAPTMLPAGANSLTELSAALDKASRRRDYKSVPMVLDNPDFWDNDALKLVIGYRAGPKQAYDNVDIAGPWLNLMRNSLNSQVFSFRHPDFLVVSATHASAHLALFDQETWDKYQLTKLAPGGKIERNTFILEQKAAAADPKDFQNPDGVYSPHNNSIPALQRRGVVFLACHNAIWEIAEKLMAADVNPDKLTHEAMAAELTNHLVSGVVLTPGAVGTLVELTNAGFSFAK